MHLHKCGSLTLQPKQSATRPPEESRRRTRLGEGSACNRSPYFEARAALSLALSARGASSTIARERFCYLFCLRSTTRCKYDPPRWSNTGGCQLPLSPTRRPLLYRADGLACVRKYALIGLELNKRSSVNSSVVKIKRQRILRSGLKALSH
ncbi:hypothetical protein EVAR_23163_1 [Eumeta japonica]|uniref:Uncharacterized protein n=1 Tax=Eumeta variegata TaxID=151549 RepID=A0A4C1VD91_EUMVA|nr:hypothetical protein EVAR_23163_1 [Eumeta japonica]